MKYVAVLFLLICSLLIPPDVNAQYKYPWPGILPDHPLYKIKVLRNKIIERLIYSPVRRVEYDLLTADKMLYAAELLNTKGETRLAQETILKGENYMSMLVSDYFHASASGYRIPESLSARISQAHVAHQALIFNLVAKAAPQDKKIYEDVLYFSRKNQEMLEEERSRRIKANE